MRANRQGGEQQFDYYFAEDTIELSENEKELIRAERREERRLREARKRREGYHRKRAEGYWKTAWQWLSEDQRKVKDDSYPEERYNWLYDEAANSFEQEKKPFYYYSEYDMVEVREEEYEELKNQYISRFGGWEKIDLEHAEYNGKKWY